MGVLLEARMRDLLVVRVVLEFAGRDGDRREIGLAIRARVQVGAGQRRRARDVEGEDGRVQLLEQRVRCSAGRVEPGALALEDRGEQLVGSGDVVDEVGHQVEHARLIGIVARAHPVVRRVAVIERVLAVRELPGDGRAENDLGRADLDGVAEAPERLALPQVSGEPTPDGRAVGLHE